MISITFLGTSSMVPTKERNVTSMFLKFEGDGILIDCGEGTQRQMNIAGINRNDVKTVLISHWHGDPHVSGLVGLIQTIGNAMRTKEEVEPLVIYGPPGTYECMEHVMGSCLFDQQIELQVHEIDPADGELLTVFEREKYVVACARLDHSVPTIGYVFIEKERLRIDVQKASVLGIPEGPILGELARGKVVTWKGEDVSPDDITITIPERRVGFILDTALCRGCMLIAKDNDLLISEASYSSELEHKAEQNKHLTGRQAAQIASMAGAKKLIVTHLSQRYKTGSDVREDAAGIFENVDVAHDFLTVHVP